MHIFNTDPRRFRLGELVKMGHRVRHKLALQSVGSLSAARLTLGRCLLAIQETRDFKNFGCSSSTHYACAKLGIARREANECKRVARALLALPALSLAAEEGRIPWGKLREIVRVASPETDDFWLELSKKFTDNQIQALVSKTPQGCIPGDVDLADSLSRSVLKCPLDSHLSLMLDRAMRVHSLKKNEASTLAEVLGASIASYLADNPLDDEAEEKARREADKDLQAARARLVPEVAAVREMAVKMGLLSPDEEFADSDPGRVHTQRDTVGSAADNATSGAERASSMDPARVLKDANSAKNTAINGTKQRAGSLENGSGETSLFDPVRVQAPNSSANGESVSASSRQERAIGSGSHGGAFSDPSQVHANENSASGTAPERCSCGEIECSGSKQSSSPLKAMSCEASTLDPGRVQANKPPTNGIATGRCSCGDMECSESEHLAGFMNTLRYEDSGPDPDRVQIPSNRTTELLAEALGITAIEDKLLPLIDPDRVQYVTLDDPWANTRVRFNILSRYATKAQKKEILRRDGWCCSTPGCCNRIWLHIHHLERFADGGKTSPRNLLGLCSACHKNVHDGLLKIERKTDGTLLFLDQEGRRLDQQVDLEMAYWLDFEIGWTGGELDSYKARCGVDWAVFAS